MYLHNLNKILTPNFFLVFLTFIFLRFIDSDLFFKGVLFIIITITLIYLPQNKLNKISISLLITLIILFLFSNEKKKIIEKSAPLKMNYQNEQIYFDYFGKEKFNFIKNYFIEYAEECHSNTLNCFQTENIKDNYISPDQLIFSKYT